MTALCKLESIVGRSIYRLLRSPLLIILLLMLHLLLLLLLLLLLPLLLPFHFSIARIADDSHKGRLTTAIASAASASSWELDSIPIPCWKMAGAKRPLVSRDCHQGIGVETCIDPILRL